MSAGRGWPLLAYVALACVLFGPGLAGGRVFTFRDLADFNIPHKLYGVSQLRSLRLPLWNPDNYCGYPHLANLQSGIFYPPNLLLFLPFPTGFNLSVVLHFVLAACGLQALAREAGMSAGAAGVAGAAFGFSPYLVSMLDLLPPLYGASWLPWLVRAGLRLGRGVTPLRCLEMAILLTLEFLAGEPLYVALALGLAVAASAVGPVRPPAAGPLAASFVTAALVSALLSAPVLLPFLELIRASERAGPGMTRDEVFRDSLAPRGIAALVRPPPPASPVGGDPESGQAYIRRPYLGLTVALLALAGLRRPGRRTLGVAALGLAGVLLALGDHFGLYPWLYDLGLNQSRYPMKFLVLTLFALALLAGRGASWLMARAGRRRWLPAAAAALLVLDLLAAGVPLVTTGEAASLVRPGPVGERIAAALDAGAGCPWPRVYTPPITAGQLAFIFREGVYDDAAIARKKALLSGNTNLYAGIPLVRGGDSVEVRWTRELLDRIDAGPAARHLLDLAGAGWFVTSQDLEGLGFEARGAVNGVRLYENPSALPHAFLVGRVLPGAGLDASFDPRTEALVESPLDGLAGAGCAGGEARVTACVADELTIATASPGRCLLVLTDTWYPGWTAEVDGTPAPVLRADRAFRGVVVAAGAHQVRFTYRPRSFSRGLTLLVAGLAGAGVLAGRAWFGARRARSPSVTQQAGRDPPSQ